MRAVLSLCSFLVSAPVLAAGDVADCMARCSAKVQPCMQGCKDDKCMNRCANQIQSCASTCEGKGVDPKLVDKAAKEQQQQATSKPAKVTGTKR